MRWLSWQDCSGMARSPTMAPSSTWPGAECSPLRVGGGEKRYQFGGEVAPCQGSGSESAFPSSQRCCSERPGAVKGAPLLGAAKRTLDGEDHSEMIAEEGKAGRKVGEKWSAKMVPSPAASNTWFGSTPRQRLDSRGLGGR